MVFHLQDRLYTECPNATHEFLGESVRERKMEAQDTQEHLAMAKNEVWWDDGFVTAFLWSCVYQISGIIRSHLDLLWFYSVVFSDVLI